jgi:hypothetical protein
MGDQHAVGVDDVGEPRRSRADLDLRHDVPDEFQVDLGRGHAAAAAGGAGDRHVWLGALAEIDRAVVHRDSTRRDEAELRVARQIGAASDGIHRQARDAQLLATVGVDPDHLGDRRRLALQLEVFDPARLERVAVGVGTRQRGPAELVLDIDDVLLDPVGGVLRLLDLQRGQVRFVLAPGEVDADRAAGDQHAADQRDDQQRVLGEEPPAPRHSMTRSARSNATRTRLIERREVRAWADILTAFPTAPQVGAGARQRSSRCRRPAVETSRPAPAAPR